MMSTVLPNRCARRLPAALAAFALAAASAVCTARPPTGTGAAEPVNPFTGQSRGLEATQRRLEQMRLETQLLEEEARQASLRGTLAAARASASPLPAATTPAAGPGSSPRLSGPRRPQPPAPPVVTRPGASAAGASAPGSAASPVAGPPAAPANAQLLAVLRDGDRRRAILQMGLGALSVQEGDEVQGMRVGPIGDNALTLDGRMLELLRGRATVPSVDRRPVGAGAAPPAPALARPQPPLPLAPPSAGLSTGNRPAATGSGWPPLPPLPGLGGPLEAVPPPGGLPRAVAPVQR